MASLTIVRDSAWQDRFRVYQIILDDEKIGEVKNGETKQFSLAPGSHRLSLKIDRLAPIIQEFMVTETDHLTFQAKPNFQGLWLLRTPYLLLIERTSNSDP